MYCIIKCIVQRKQARVKNADLHHPSCTVCNVKTQIYFTRPQCVNLKSVNVQHVTWCRIPDTTSFLFTGLSDNLRPHLDSTEAQNLERGKTKPNNNSWSYAHKIQVKTDGQSVSNFYMSEGCESWDLYFVRKQNGLIN